MTTREQLLSDVVRERDALKKRLEDDDPPDYCGKCGQWKGITVERDRLRMDIDTQNLEVAGLRSEYDALRAEVERLQVFEPREGTYSVHQLYAHMCRDGHMQIGHNDSENEMCPLCTVIADRDAAWEIADKHRESWKRERARAAAWKACALKIRDWASIQEYEESMELWDAARRLEDG